MSVLFIAFSNPWLELNDIGQVKSTATGLETFPSYFETFGRAVEVYGHEHSSPSIVFSIQQVSKTDESMHTSANRQVEGIVSEVHQETRGQSRKLTTASVRGLRQTQSTTALIPKNANVDRRVALLSSWNRWSLLTPM